MARGARQGSARQHVEGRAGAGRDGMSSFVARRSHRGELSSNLAEPDARFVRYHNSPSRLRRDPHVAQAHGHLVPSTLAFGSVGTSALVCALCGISTRQIEAVGVRCCRLLGRSRRCAARARGARRGHREAQGGPPATSWVDGSGSSACLPFFGSWTAAATTMTIALGYRHELSALPVPDLRRSSGTVQSFEYSLRPGRSSAGRLRVLV